MVRVTFVGGPRDGRTGEYSRNPKLIGCRDEWVARGMKRGLYKVRPGQGPELIADWVNV